MLPKIRIHKLLALPLLALFALVVVGCHRNSDLVGTWNVVTLSGQPLTDQWRPMVPTLTLQSDGQFQVTKINLHGTWTVEDSAVVLHAETGHGSSAQRDSDLDQKLTLSEDRKTLSMKYNQYTLTLQKQATPTPPQ